MNTEHDHTSHECAATTISIASLMAWELGQATSGQIDRRFICELAKRGLKLGRVRFHWNAVEVEILGWLVDTGTVLPIGERQYLPFNILTGRRRGQNWSVSAPSLCF